MTDLEANGMCNGTLKDGRRCSQAALSPNGMCKRHGGERDNGERPRKLVLSEQMDGYLHKLAAEWLLGEPQDEFMGNRWTERGKELEPHARAAFAFEHNVEPQQVGFVWRDDSQMVGCSPDWLMLDDRAGGEVKCPNAGTHIGFLLGERVCPAEYMAQVQMSLWVCREQCDHWWFVSFCPELPLFTARVDPDPAWQAALDEHIPRAVERLLEMRAKLEAMTA